MAKFTVGTPEETEKPTVEVELSETDFLPVGAHTFQLVVIDDSGNESLPAQARVVVKDTQRPTAVIIGPESAELGRSFSLDGSRSSDILPGRIVTYRWTLLGRT